MFLRILAVLPFIGILLGVPFVNRVEPLVLGMPFVLAWIVRLSLLIATAAPACWWSSKTPTTLVCGAGGMGSTPVEVSGPHVQAFPCVCTGCWSGF